MSREAMKRAFVAGARAWQNTPNDPRHMDIVNNQFERWYDNEILSVVSLCEDAKQVVDDINKTWRNRRHWKNG